MPEVIDSIAAAVEIVKALKETPFVTRATWPLDKFPFGLWFRGHEDLGHDDRGHALEPRVFRRSGGVWDETNVFEHLQLRLPNYRSTYQTAFDWLCLLQHNLVPTRLLDWSESILPALYFAVRDRKMNTGELIILNARRLNQHTKTRSTISTITDSNVVIRSEMAARRSLKRFKRNPAILAALQFEGIAERSNWVDNYRTPIAVFPSRLNDRMIFQASVFTLHGGKHYVKQMREEYDGDMLPEPISIEKVDAQCEPDAKIILRYPVTNKAAIHDDLLLLGIHEGTLFPEIERQAIYLEKLWRYDS